mmetsp:Transcript_66668/g.191609  ORF Transcript_66668/g.191609 Transcript_66668/m.191609 type:complete len:204 (+) Transcript_66668:46-657(+)
MAGFAAAQIRGLKGAAELNDQLALCKGFVEDTGRWLVELETGEEKAVKNDNLLTTLDPGATLLLERGCVAHVTVGRTAVWNSMEEENRESLHADLATFGGKFEVRTELNVVEGWPQFSVVLRGHPDQISAALEELGALFGYYQMPFKSSRSRGSSGGQAADALEAEAQEEPELVEVEGMTVSSMEKRERRGRPKVDRYGRPTV